MRIIPVSTETAVFVGYILGIVADVYVRPALYSALRKHRHPIARARWSSVVETAAATILACCLANPVIPAISALTGVLTAILTVEIVFPSIDRWNARRRSKRRERRP